MRPKKILIILRIMHPARRRRRHQRIAAFLAITCALVSFIVGFMLVSVAMRGL